MADAFTSNYNLTLPEVGGSRDSWGSKTNANWSAVDAAIKANQTAAAAANTNANGRVARTGDTMTGALTTPTLYVDANGYLTVSGDTAVINLDAGDAIHYGRASNTLNFMIGGVARLGITATDVISNVPINGVAPTQPSHLVTKTYVDAGLAGKVNGAGGTISSDLTLQGNLSISLAANPASGAIFVGNAGRFLQQDGTNWVFGGGASAITLNGQTVYHTGNFNPGVYAPLTGANFNGVTRSNKAFVANSNGSNPLVGCWDTAQGSAIALMLGSSNTAFISNITSDGDYAGSWRMAIDAGGNGTFQGNVTAYSDARLKENVEEISGGLALVNKLCGVRYTRNDQADKDKVHVGLIAQSVEKVVPEVVGEIEGTKVLNYSALVAVLIQAVRELSDRLDDLEDEAI